MDNLHLLKVALAQISPVWLNKQKTIDKIESFVLEAGQKGCDLITFGEALLPGYPYWLSFANGSEFNSIIQKEIFAHYLKNAIQIESGELDKICNIAKKNKIAVYLGIVERAQNRGSHSLYCSLVYINKEGIIKSVHRKLQPTYEERLVWASGDGNGLQVHPIKQFNLGGLNCWENWMPLPRMALYGLGVNLHVAVWPGSEFLTNDITRFIAKESRSFVISVSGFMRKEDIPKETPHFEKIIQNAPEILSNGGSCIANPDGSWLKAPIVDNEQLIIAEIDVNRVFEERQNFDLSGHYSRPDVTKLNINRERQSIVNYNN